MQKPLINILTRTSNRPNGFKKNVENIRKQTYKNINHIVCTDDKNSIPYIVENGCDDYILIDRDNLIKNDNYPNPHTGVYSPHNLYFNEMIKSVTSGWVIYLDDDDTFTGIDTVEKIVNVINQHSEDSIIYWRMIYPSGRVLPHDMSKGKNPMIGGIGGSCFTFHSKYKNDSKWDSWKCGDFRLIQKLHNKIPNKVWVPENFICVPMQGMGNKKDIN